MPYECDNFMDLFFQMRLYNQRATIMQYYGEQRKVFLPDLYKGVPITAIASDAFLNCRAMEILRLPGKLETIFPSAFAGCSALEKVLFPESLASIQVNAFWGCATLKSVWGVGVQHVEEKAFWNCDALEEAIFAKDVVLHKFSGIDMNGRVSGETMWFSNEQ